MDVAPRRDVAVLEKGRQVLLAELQRAVRHDLHVAEALVVEACGELVVPAAQGHKVSLEGVHLPVAAVVDVDVRLVGVSVGAQPLGVNQPHEGSRLARDLQARDARHVLSEVVEVVARAEAPHAPRTERLHVADRTHLLGGDMRRGRLAKPRGLPRRVVERRRAPGRVVEAGVVVFARVDAVEGQRARRGFPFGARGDRLLRAVGVFDAQVEAIRQMGIEQVIDIENAAYTRYVSQ